MNKHDKVWWITEIIGSIILIYGGVGMAMLLVSALFNSSVTIIQKVYMITGYMFCIYGWSHFCSSLIANARKKIRGGYNK